MTLEFDYLTRLAREYLRREKATVAPPDGLDWSRFLQLCGESRVAGTVLPRIDRDGLDPSIVGRIDAAQQQAFEATILRLLHLERILPLLDDAGCRPVVLKGGVLATHYYRRPEHRFLADLDLLVERDLVETTCRILAGQGLSLTATEAAPEYYRDHHFHWIMGNGRGFVVEVHWALTLPGSIYHFDLDLLRSRLRSKELNRATMTVPAPPDLLLHVVAQCNAGGYGELRWLLDAALILREIDDPAALIRQAREQNQDAALWLLLQQVQQWTGVSIGEDFVAELAPGRRTARILASVAGDMVSRSREFRERGEMHQLLHWLCCPTSALRRRESWRFLRPGPEYWLEQGYTSRKRPSLATRLRAGLGRWKTALYLARIAADRMR